MGPPQVSDFIKVRVFQVKEMSTGATLPLLVHSMTAYYGAGPIVKYVAKKNLEFFFFQKSVPRQKLVNQYLRTYTGRSKWAQT